MRSPAPIALFVYDRPLHAEQTLESLRRNPESSDSDLIIFSDGSRSLDDAERVRRTRAVIAAAGGFRSVRVVLRDENWGLARSIIGGVGEVLRDHGRVIVLEDDMITSPRFLGYMNAALDRYADEPSVGSVHAYMYPIEGLPEFFFTKGGDCWGWGTWRDRWSMFEPDGRALLRELKRRGLLKEFDRTGGNHMVRMLIGQIRGENCSWFIRWHASLFLNGKLTLQPGRSFIHNIGADGSGTHFPRTALFDVLPERSFAGLPSIEPAADCRATEEIRKFFERGTGEPWYKAVLQNWRDEIRLRRVLHG
jgi:hypothetical protein